MSGPKRFWTDVDVTEVGGGFAVTLDGRSIKSPAKQEFIAPTRALANAVADEWRGQGEVMDPRSMPQTRYVNSVIDGVASRRAAVIETVAAYGGSDLLCYRAEHPEELIARQAERWNPLLDWARDTYDAPLILGAGVMPVAQPAPSLSRFSDAVAAHGDFELAGLHDLVSISGSLVIGLAVSSTRLSADDAFDLSRLDDDWQIEQWGKDEDAMAVAALKRTEFTEAARLLTLVREA
jgi:chaperone required for assembly of F1-ATPase